MTKTFSLLILAAGLSGCAGGTLSPADSGPANDRNLPPGEGAFGRGLTWEPGKKEEPAKPAAATPAASTASTPSAASAAERQEFEEWRAWQEWKRKNPK
jgi:hypothetical protein